LAELLPALQLAMGHSPFMTMAGAVVMGVMSEMASRNPNKTSRRPPDG
jgi:hypothetical protein